MPSTPSMHMRTGFSGLLSRAAVDDKYRVSKRTQGHGNQGATDKDHHERRAGRGSPYRARNQTNVDQSGSLAERVRCNSAARIQNRIQNSNGTLTQPTKAGRKFGNVLENLQTSPSLCRRRGDRKYRKSAFSFGTVFSTAHHTPAGGPDDPEHTTSTRHHGRVYSKYRRFVVVECNEVSLVALPIYTCNGTGLSRKPSREIPEYIDVVDRRVDMPGPAQGVNGRLFCVADGEDDDAPVLRDNKNNSRVGAKGDACVRLTEPCSFRYGVWAQIEARLTDDSARLLRELRATKMAAACFGVLQDLSPADLVGLLGRMVQADLVEKAALLQAESLVEMRARKQSRSMTASSNKGVEN
ncbi:hypothetical protein PoMZ_11524 [Pyricularia oryzae]|uniref:DUF6590 domain-containing protein n=1 Tax=Pyricularia oryzae TaxID=318829 RepID=A0A4P7NKJ9_PYROR|nr:hypothetical protein PoMZ_11524 [Pyricularia oryzae]